MLGSFLINLTKFVIQIGMLFLLNTLFLMIPQLR